jgi:hypothetical protein
MRLLAIFVVFLLASMAASAEWVLVTKLDKVDIYVESSSIRKNNQMGRLWALHNWNSIQNGNYLSERSRLEFDCKNELWRTFSVSFHEKPFAHGETLPAPFATTPNWFAVAPQTTASKLFALACSN